MASFCYIIKEKKLSKNSTKIVTRKLVPAFFVSKELTATSIGK